MFLNIIATANQIAPLPTFSVSRVGLLHIRTYVYIIQLLTSNAPHTVHASGEGPYVFFVKIGLTVSYYRLQSASPITQQPFSPGNGFD